jgi:hypothetical protein
VSRMLEGRERKRLAGQRVKGFGDDEHSHSMVVSTAACKRDVCCRAGKMASMGYFHRTAGADRGVTPACNRSALPA